MKTYTIKPDNVKKLALLQETSIPHKLEGSVALFDTGSAFLKALTYLRRHGARCATESTGQ